ncbi:uncharacterized protein PADG_01883 [Paracoccidioides brasiliensis Pb18]|uniref:Beta-lactamase-related domain-containing protein n=1 Tax=Paracoccidioides brasiliensis (strain Pb18) TaxID=502780 RepID=C1G4L7_PARBD|nr:uncharacterized protein PADG_01883 [Paracoccidioides brasiliensis Pb18]EEH45733.2 hypothetical protein PADG_01883 [Paracoccidioides brasiliensis Pb18]
MDAFDKIAESLTAEDPNRALPGVAMVAADSKGKLRNIDNNDGCTGDVVYSKGFGFNSAGPITVDTPLWIASCSKLITSIALLQCVEKGLIGLDEHVGRILPELSDLDILHGFDEATREPLLKKAKNKITYRHLLTHTSGLGYDMWTPSLIQWRNFTKTSPVSGLVEVDKLLFPLLFEPGEGWVYGVGLDWAGKAVERLNEGIKLEEYLKTHIWEPLGMQHTTFRPSQSNYVLENRAKATTRTTTGELITTPVDIWATLHPADDFGGHGIWSTAAEFIKPLISILKDDGKLLSPKMRSNMFEPQLSTSAHLLKFMHSSRNEAAMTNGLLGNLTWNYSLVGILAMEETPNRRSRGSTSWFGLPNLAWWIDPERGTCGVYATQLYDSCDAQSLSLSSQFEATIFQHFGTPSVKQIGSTN